MFDKAKIYLACGFVFLCILAFVSGYHLGSSAVQLFDGAGIDEVRDQLEQAGHTQSEITSRSAGAESTAQDISRGLQQAEDSAGRIDGELKDAGEIIAECQSILAAVRSRGKEEAANR